MTIRKGNITKRLKNNGKQKMPLLRGGEQELESEQIGRIV